MYRQMFLMIILLYSSIALATEGSRGDVLVGDDFMSNLNCSKGENSNYTRVLRRGRDLIEEYLRESFSKNRNLTALGSLLVLEKLDYSNKFSIEEMSIYVSFVNSEDIWKLEIREDLSTGMLVRRNASFIEFVDDTQEAYEFGFLSQGLVYIERSIVEDDSIEPFQGVCLRRR